MVKAMYSTEEVADILGLHVRTVRGYVRDGRLPATRIGKQYRITRGDLDAFTGTQPDQGSQREQPDRRNQPDQQDEPVQPDGTPDGPPRVEVSAIVQVAPVSPDAMTRLVTLVTGAAGSQREGGDQLHIQTIYDQHRASVRIIVIGTAGDTAALLALVSTLTRRPE